MNPAVQFLLTNLATLHPLQVAARSVITLAATTVREAEGCAPSTGAAPDAKYRTAKSTLCQTDSALATEEGVNADWITAPTLHEKAAFALSTAAVSRSKNTFFLSPLRGTILLTLYLPPDEGAPATSITFSQGTLGVQLGGGPQHYRSHTERSPRDAVMSAPRGNSPMASYRNMAPTMISAALSGNSMNQLYSVQPSSYPAPVAHTAPLYSYQTNQAYTVMRGQYYSHQYPAESSNYPVASPVGSMSSYHQPSSQRSPSFMSTTSIPSSLFATSSEPRVPPFPQMRSNSFHQHSPQASPVHLAKLPSPPALPSVASVAQNMPKPLVLGSPVATSHQSSADRSSAEVESPFSPSVGIRKVEAECVVVGEDSHRSSLAMRASERPTITVTHGSTPREQTSESPSASSKVLNISALIA